MTRPIIGIVFGVLSVAFAGFAAAPPGTANPDLGPLRPQDSPKKPPAAAPGEKRPEVTPAGHAGIAGRWEISRPARALLGHDKDKFQNADLEIEFVDRFPDKTPDDKDIAEESEAIQKDMKKAGHTLLTMGRISYPTDSPQKHAFALSHSRDKTSLWVVFPFNALEVPVSLVPGRTREKDLLFLYWPTLDGTANCWAFQRRAGEKPDGVNQPDAPKLGTLSGRFVFDGDVPVAKDLLPAFSKIDPDKPQVAGPDGRFNGVEGVYREFLAKGIRPKTDDPSLLVGKDRGIANIVIWVASKDVPWTEPKEWQPAAIKLKNGNYTPRVTVAAAGQPVSVENHDPVGFHFRIDPGRPRNSAMNQLLKPNPAGAPLKLTWEDAESVPARYESNLGPWATGWLFVHRNSFVAVSAADGSFALPNLPPGEWEFRVWHERRGFVKHWPKGVFKHTIKPGENDLGVIKLKPEFFAADKTPEPPAAPLDREPTDDHLYSLTKKFLVAMRNHHADKNANALREFFDPRYLKEHRLTDGDLRAEMAAVGNIRSYEIAADRRTILCFVETKEDSAAKEPLKELILIRVAVHEGRLFLVPPKAPDPKTGAFAPWLLRTKANR